MHADTESLFLENLFLKFKNFFYKSFLNENVQKNCSSSCQNLLKRLKITRRCFNNQIVTF